MIKHGRSPYLECSSRGDKRFSAFYAFVVYKGNRRPIEDHYQAFKVFEVDGKRITGLHWREAKGKKAINQQEAAEFYAMLWDLYIKRNPDLLEVIKAASGISDIFGKKGSQCQATELWRIKQEHSK